MQLSHMKENDKGIITDVNTHCTSSRRLFDLGFVEGQEITCANIGFSGSPIAYNIAGCKIALRKKDADKIGVTL